MIKKLTIVFLMLALQLKAQNFVTNYDALVRIGVLPAGDLSAAYIDTVNKGINVTCVSGCAGAGTSNSNIIQWAGITLGSPSNYGTSPGAVMVPGVNAFITNSPTIANTSFAATQGTSPWIVAGGGTAGTAATGVVTIQGIASMVKLLVTPDSVALPANQSVNVSQINGVTPLMGNGTTGTGSLRVTIASDNTAFSVNATLSAETTKVIGTVNQGTSPWVVSVPTWAGGTLGAMANYGTSPGAVLVPGVNAFITNIPAVTQSGTWNIGTVTTVTTVTTVSTVTNLSQIATVVPTFGDVNNVAAIAGVLNVGPVGRYNATAPTLTDTRYNMLQLDVRGGLHVVPGTSGFSIANTGFNATLQTQTDTIMVGGVNIKEINAVTPLMGNGVTGTGSLRVTVASDNTAFSVNSTLQTQTDTVMVGGVNIKEINAITPLMGNGVTGTGSLRVTVASDNTAFSVNSTLQTQTDTVMVGGVNIKEINAVTPLMGNGVTGTGSLRVTVSSDNTAFQVKTLGNAGGIFDIAPANSVPANVLMHGAKAVNAEQTAVTNGQAQWLITDLVGKLITVPYANTENEVHGTTAAITDTTSTSIIASAGGSLRNYVTDCTVSNSHATVSTFVKVLEGTNIIWECQAQAAGGGCVATFPMPRRSAAATAINCQPVTTGANVICSCGGYKGL